MRHNSSRDLVIPGPAGCALMALALLAWCILFLKAEEQIPILVYMISGCLLVLVAALSDLHKSISATIASNEAAWDGCMIGVMLLLMITFRDDHYTLLLLGTIMAYATAVLGLNVQLGFTGVINFSAASFFGIGCYTAAILGTAGWPSLLCLVMGGVMAALVGCLLLAPVLRTSGHYAALVTMAFALLFRVFLEVSDLLGGPQGVAVPPMQMFGVDFSQAMQLWGSECSFYLRYDIALLILLSLSFAFVRRLERSWIGLSMDAVRSDETASACFGINIAKWKIVAFTLGNLLSGLSGALYGMMLAYISPANYAFADSLIFLSILLLGGIGNSWGVILATVFVVVVPEKFQVIQEYRYLLYAALVLFMIIYRPMGLLPRKVRNYGRLA
ncbi:MAG: branched-chain amino acid ABC transporter permease [Desulfovibrio sp.]|jgi:ABC-type branched-subunit amino acid transport system permease subunit|nr:branched-chain amino acid ABC transporter permease [Desulfovibrio sp.]